LQSRAACEEPLLSILHPETAPHLQALPVGLLPFRHAQTGKLLLAVKAPKEMILAARMNQGFKIYVVPLASTVGVVPALVTAFFDETNR
jgi:hypothetical protein